MSLGSAKQCMAVRPRKREEVRYITLPIFFLVAHCVISCDKSFFPLLSSFLSSLDMYRILCRKFFSTFLLGSWYVHAVVRRRENMGNVCRPNKKIPSPARYTNTHTCLLSLCTVLCIYTVRIHVSGFLSREREKCIKIVCICIRTGM